MDRYKPNNIYSGFQSCFNVSRLSIYLTAQWDGGASVRLGALLVSAMEPLLPYALSFAAGAMIYVVIDDIIPEAQACGNGKLASWGAMIGFVIMMSLDLM